MLFFTELLSLFARYHPMKIVVQNGIQHCFSRKEIEAMVQLFPVSWSRNVKTVLLGTTNKTGMTITFYPKSQTLYVTCPSQGIRPSKVDAIEALLVTLAIIDETGSLPKKISSSVRAHALAITSELAQSCIQLVGLEKTNNSISSETKTP